MRSHVFALVGLAIVGACGLASVGCNRSARGGDAAGGADMMSTTCVEGAHQCAGNVWNVCYEGAYVAMTTCSADLLCSDDNGCTPCIPGNGACAGDRIVDCDSTGQPTSVQEEDCSPSTCVVSNGTAMCVGPCDPAALAKSYTGCVYFSVDLPQFAQPEPGGLGGSVAADQPYGIAVANPWTVPIDVLVEEDDAMVGSPPQVSQVMKQTVAAGGVAVLTLPQREVSGYVKGSLRNRTLLTAKGYRITTSRPASVYQFNPLDNPNAYSNDASLLIPENALDESYLVLGWPGAGGDVSAFGLVVKTDKRSFVTIVGTRAGTKLRVTPSTEVMAGDNVPAMHKGTPYTFTLNEFEVLNLEGADFMPYGATDFTGTRIDADGPLAVFSGIECVDINPPNSDPDSDCCCDHLEEQIFPRGSLGMDYVAVRSESRDHASVGDPEFFRVMALDDNTDVTTSLPSPDDHFTLSAGGMHQILSTDDFTVSATKAVMVGQFQVSMDSSAGMSGDPSFELVPPLAQFRSKYIFSVPQGYSENWLLISVPSGEDVTLDGQPAGGCDRGTAGSSGGMMYDALRCPVPEGAHTLAAANGSTNFGLVVEGWGPGPVSYGYTGGMEFQTLNHDCVSDANCQSGEFCAGGTCTPTIQ